ncbi:MAG: type secretion system protein GspE [Dehalococcoidia bacterium]|nr:type secretion system protein GspE [Dehalococcoidia bacterium]
MALRSGIMAEVRGSRFERRLGQVLVEGGFITKEQLGQAEEQVKKDGKRLVSVLQERGWASKDTLTTVLSFHLKVPVADPRQVEVNQDAVRLVSEETAQEYTILPLSLDRDGTLRVLMEDPGDFDTINRLANLTGRQIRPVLPLGEGLKELIRRNYGIGTKVEEAIERATQAPPAQRGGGRAMAVEAEPGMLAERDISQAPAAYAVDMITLQAIKGRASDIHMRPGKDSARVLYRVDGVLQDGPVVPLTLHEGMISRIKVLANMNITETRRPQDGHFSMSFGERQVDFRVSTTPTTWGELMVIRALDRATSLKPLPELGMDGAALHTFRRILQFPYGMILVSGPTGSGKTTTLYAALHELIDGRRNIITIEEPVEYRVDEINQVEVNRLAGIDFATGLRSILRLDPDIILVGEIRDAETAAMAVDSALTGHLVLSAIHANSAAASAARLIEMGVQPFLLASSLVGVEAQRLARKICEHCKVLREPSAAEAMAYEQLMQEAAEEFYVGEGCNLCGHTGFSGRVGIFEVLPVSEEIQRLIASGATAGDIRNKAVEEGMIPLEKAGMLKVKAGETTIAEVIRTTFSTL